jgi:hypothetical protein
MGLPKSISAGFVLLFFAFSAPSNADIITIQVEGTVTRNLTEESKGAPLLEVPLGAPVVASFRIDTDDFTTTVIPLVPPLEPLQGTTFRSRVRIGDIEFSENFVTSEPLLPPGVVSLLRIGSFSLGVEETFGTAPVRQPGGRWELLELDFGFGFADAAIGLDLRDFEFTADQGLFGNSRVFYTAGPVVDGERRTDIWQSINFQVRRMYALASSDSRPAAIEGDHN